jgi:NADH-quinone oxidoreductase subunit N
MGKLYVFSAAWEGGLGWLALVGVLSSAVAAFFYLRLVARMFMQEPGEATALAAGRSLRLDIVIAVAGTLIVGLIPAPFIFLIERSLVAAAGS